MGADKEKNLDLIFKALSDSTRRGMLTMLSQEELSVTELGEPFGMTKQSVSKHLNVLENAGFIIKLKSGRVKKCLLDPEPLRIANDCIAEYHKYWSAQFDALDEYINKQFKKNKR